MSNNIGVRERSTNEGREKSQQEIALFSPEKERPLNESWLMEGENRSKEEGRRNRDRGLVRCPKRSDLLIRCRIDRWDTCPSSTRFKTVTRRRE